MEAGKGEGMADVTPSFLQVKQKLDVFLIGDDSGIFSLSSPISFSVFPRFWCI